MTVSTQVVRFQKSTGGNGTTQDVNLNFTPEALIVFSSGGTTDAAAANEYQQCVGFSDGTNHACYAIGSDDASAAADTGRIHSNADVFIRLSQSVPTTTVVCRGSVAFATNKVTFTWTVNDAVATYITLWAIAGDDITGVKVNTVNINETVDNNTEDYTGLGFTPQGDGHTALFLLGINHTANSSSAPTTTAISLFSCTTDATTTAPASADNKQWYLCQCAENAADPSDTWRISGLDRNYAIQDTAGAFDHYGWLNAWITDGFQMKYENAPASSTVKFSYLVIDGGNWDSGTLTTPTSATNDVDTTVSVSSNTIKGALFAGVGSTVTASILTNSIYSIGATDGTTQSVQSAIDEDAQATMDGYRYTDATSVYYIQTLNGALTDRATFDSFGTNSFRLDYPTKAATAQLLHWVVVADQTANQLFERPITESSISVSDTNARVLMANRSLSESSISVSDTNARVLFAFRTLSEASISVNETLERLRTVPRSISEPSISVSDALDRQLLATRVLSESSISVSDALERMLSAFRTISESPITVSDIVVGAKFLLREINEAAITVSDALERTLSAFRTLSEPSISVSEALTRILTAFRTISETSISVSETLERTVIFPRSISEPSISVSDALARQLIATRVLAESSISVSEALNRVLSAFRTISEPSISVSDALEEIGIFPRTIDEATVSVSDALARVLTAFRTISEASISVSDAVLAELIAIQTRTITEPAISVSETLARMLSAFRTLTEPSISVSDAVLAESAGFQVRTITEPSISISDLIAALKTFPALATYIVDNGYTNPTRVRITFKSKIDDDLADPAGDQIIYYQYDAFDPNSRPFNILNFSLRLVQGEVSTATLDIEDSAQNIIDRSKISFNAEVEIDFKKEHGRDWTRVMTGYVRRLGIMRPATNALIYRVTVLSKSIIYNERVTNFKRAAKRTAIDSSIPLSTDSKMHANRLFEELHTATDILPLKKPTIQKSGDFKLNSGSISEEVSDFIAEIAPGLGVAADVANAIAEVTGAIWGTDEFGEPFLRYPTEKHSGIIIKDDPQDTDSAVNTSVNMDSFEFEDVIDPAEGFANRLYVLNSKDTKSTASSSKGSGNITLTTRWIAQSFIATDNNITGVAFILSKIGNPTNTTGTIKGVLRGSSTPAGTFPTGATLATFEISLSELSNSADVIFVNDIKTANGVITPGNKYWWVLQGTGLIDDTHTVRWHHDNDLSTTGRPPSGRLPLVDADPTTPGNQFNWIISNNGPVFAFSTFSSVNHILTQSDHESIRNTGTLVEAIVNLPAFDDDATFQKVLVKILQSSAKVKRIFSYARVTIPTGRFFLPGELVTVIDSKAKLNTEKVINAEIAEVSYNLDTTSNALGIKYADLRLIGFIDPVVDNYLENKEC